MALKKHIIRFLKRDPGKRFQHYYRLINRRINHNIFLKIAFTFIGTVLLLIGVILLFMPGPGLLFILLGVVLLCLSSHKIAVFLDQLEMRTRRWVGRYKK